MLFSIIFMTAIILAASFGLHIMPIESLYKLPADVAGHALYVCPAVSNTFDPIAKSLRPYIVQINMFFFFAIMLLFFGWGWSLYQNLLKDKFEQNAFKNPWWFTKAIFWLAVIFAILIYTPNHYRTVHIEGVAGEWVLCEDNTPGARPVKSEAVKR